MNFDEICKLLASNEKNIELELVFSGTFTHDQIEILRKKISENPNVVQLSFRIPGTNPAVFKHFFNGLSLKTVIKLALKAYIIEDSLVKYLVEALKTADKLESFCLRTYDGPVCSGMSPSSYDASLDATKLLADALLSKKLLRELDLGSFLDSLTEEKISIFQKMISNHPKLVNFNFIFNQNALSMIFKVLKATNKVSSLLLKCESGSDKIDFEISALKSFLENNPNLKKFQILDFPFSSEMLCLLLENESITSLELTARSLELNFRTRHRVDFNADETKLISEALSKNKTLTELALSNMTFQGTQFPAALSKHPSLERLALLKSAVQSGFKEIIENRNLIQLRIDEDRTKSSEGISESIEKGLEKNRNLIFIGLPYHLFSSKIIREGTLNAIMSDIREAYSVVSYLGKRTPIQGANLQKNIVSFLFDAKKLPVYSRAVQLYQEKQAASRLKEDTTTELKKKREEDETIKRLQS